MNNGTPKPAPTAVNLPLLVSLVVVPVAVPVAPPAPVLVLAVVLVALALVPDDAILWGLKPSKPTSLRYSPLSGPDSEVVLHGTALPLPHQYCARIRLHRFRAFSDIPIFLERHCDITAINDTLPPGQIDPDADQATTFSNIDDAPQTSSNPVTFCMQRHASCYAMLMILYKVRASSASGRLSDCSYLFSQPESGTEVQDSERLVEELQHGVGTALATFKDYYVAFEAISGMDDKIEGAFKPL
ncbi:hypothetical protein VTN00DRAFT_1375 [Thermoascus crustaceus]|uniref:uncharacterized protein n=1 Tax=Thermoascus crustaceus TaxID=5088 RepID=UPI00374492F0